MPKMPIGVALTHPSALFYFGYLMERARDYFQRREVARQLGRHENTVEMIP